MNKGSKFIVFKSNDSLILKKLEPPILADFDKLVDWGTAFAKKRKITPRDVIKGD